MPTLKTKVTRAKLSNLTIQAIEKPLLEHVAQFEGEKIALKSGAFSKKFQYLELINRMKKAINDALPQGNYVSQFYLDSGMSWAQSLTLRIVIVDELNSPFTIDRTLAKMKNNIVEKVEPIIKKEEIQTVDQIEKKLKQIDALREKIKEIEKSLPYWAR